MKKIMTALFLYFISLYGIDSTYVAFAGSAEADGYYAAIDTTLMYGVQCPVFFNGSCTITKIVEPPEGKYEGGWWELRNGSNNLLYSAGIDESNVEETPVINDWDVAFYGTAPSPIAYFGEYLLYDGKYFNETTTESGIIDDSKPATIKHNSFKGRCFSGTNGEDFCSTGKVIITGLPGGLTAALIREDSLTLSFNISGQVSSHDNADDTSVSFELQDTAFSCGDASSVKYSGYTFYVNFSQTMYVAPSGGDYTNLYDAVVSGWPVSGNGDIIYIAPGTYVESRTVSIYKSITIIGSGKDETVISVPEPGVTGNNLIVMSTGSNTDGNSEISISGVTLLGGDITEAYISARNGGCIKINEDTTVFLEDVTVSGSEAENGGGIYNLGILVMNGCDVRNNISAGYGGGICNFGNITAENCIFDGNSAYYSGGGIYSSNNSETELRNSTISNNTATNFNGGGIFAYSGLSVVNCTVAFNSGNRSGGGISVTSDSDFLLLNSTVTENSSADPGGGVSINGCMFDVYNSVIASNYSDTAGSDYYFAYNGTLNDLGYNCIGFQSFAGTPENWYFDQASDILFNMKADSTVSNEWTRNNTALSNQTLGLDSVLADNFTKNGIQTVAVLNGSFLIDAGTDLTAGDITVPELDQRGWDRYGMVDIGAYEYGTATVPRNLNAVSDGSAVTLTWDPVDGALSYIVYASVKPYSDFQNLTSFGVFNCETEWTVPYAGQKMFFYIVSSPYDRENVPVLNVTDKKILEYLTK